jgi:hypothetical protein
MFESWGIDGNCMSIYRQEIRRAPELCSVHHAPCLPLARILAAPSRESSRREGMDARDGRSVVSPPAAAMVRLRDARGNEAEAARFLAGPNARWRKKRSQGASAAEVSKRP